ncbi:hypothetical protein K493DRAFT_212806 [Basidiobolus meristosporus CBS 931.73]|uniref:SH3 domain-containing protein n=1 Tax=Basidiobolus meristosporus CBS 931.73 TaxID=1314790 RepID=A0A1Y1YMW3_9FUNG|nr:hypothetical protein K493DRAFT_212806 [Basidiobolus meristosporus CBS 931.73]|eukprot:ORX99318.1 hypothetical protein K493DRAFT_212806 [Basidiobolus meristosporus CBS 931.73]
MIIPSKPLLLSISNYGLLYLLFSSNTFLAVAQHTQTTIDFASLSQLGIAGEFNGISAYSPNGNVSRLDPNVDSLIRKTKNSLELIGYTSLGGRINSMCHLPSKQGGGNTEAQSSLFIAGNFTHIGGVEVNNIAVYNPTSKVFSPLAKGLDGPVYDIYCDTKRNIVYVGGAFISPVPNNPLDKYGLLRTFSGSLAAWSNGNWTGFSFKGLNGPVYTIGASEDSNGIFFGGGFNATADGAQNLAPNTQEVNLGTASISAGNSIDTQEFSNPRNIVCGDNTNTTNNIWLVRDNGPGYWWAQLPVTITPSLLRLQNTNHEGRGTKTFRVSSIPGNQVLPLSYYNSTTQKTVQCSDECPLNQDPNLPFQEFRVVQPTVPITLDGINIEILSWYGAGGGLGRVELYQSDIIVHAIGEYNYPNCSANAQSLIYGASHTGDWMSQIQPGSSKSILSYTIKSADDNTVSITYTPFIPESGYYEIWASVPGCYATECNNRVSVDYGLTLTKSATQPTTNTISQNELFDNIVLVFMGYVTASSADFQPKVVMTVSKKSALQAGKVVVADSIQFVKVSSLFNLNGVIEYFPDTPATPEGIPVKTLRKSLPDNSVVKSIVSTNTTVFIGGDFQGVDRLQFANVVKYNRDSLIPFVGGYPRGPVNSMILRGNELIIGGDFDGLVGNSQLPIRNIGRYNVVLDKWLAIGNGVNDEVRKLVPSGLDTIHVIGDFNAIYGNNTVTNLDRFSTGFTAWNFSSNSWVNPAYVSGRAHTSISFAADNSTTVDSQVGAFYLGGAFSSAAAIQVQGFIVLDSQGSFQQLGSGPGSEIESPTINCGTYYVTKEQDNGQNISYPVVGGIFKSTGISNIAIFDNGMWKGIGAGVSGEVNGLHVAEDQLFIGGLSNNATVPFTGFSIWNFRGNGFVDVPSLKSDSTGNSLGDVSVKVNNIQRRPGTSNIIVSGWFKRAGSLDCKNICAWDMKDKQWTSLSSGLEGEVTDMIVANNEILAVGNFVLSSGQGYLASYDFSKSQWRRIESKGGDDGLPGAVLSIVQDSSNNVHYVSGQNEKDECYIRRWDGSQFSALPTSPLPSSKISRMSIVPTKSSPNANNGIVLKVTNDSETDGGSALLVVGALVFEQFGNVSAALFDGKEWIPFLVSSKRDGSPGLIKSAFTKSIVTFTSREHLPLPLVILISVAASLGLVFLIMLIGLTVIYLKRKRKAVKYPHPNALYAKKPQTADRAGVTSIVSSDSRPISGYSDQYRSQAVPTGTSMTEKNVHTSRNSTSGALSPSIFGVGLSEKHSSASPTIDPSIASSPERYTAISEPKSGAAISPDRYQVYYAKFPFNAREHGELGFQAGEKIYVIDNTDDIWWMGIIDHGKLINLQLLCI